LGLPAFRVAHADDGAVAHAAAMPPADDADTPFQRLRRHDVGGRYNQAPYDVPDVHARFPYGGGQVVTGVGRGWTWVAKQPPAPFKILYTCFERRRPELEAANDGGVASGGGWHRIGDHAETILNDLEPAPVVVGAATTQPWLASHLPSGAFAYQLGDVATIRWLHPGEAFTTRRGAPPQENFHWFVFQQDREVCTEEWVHPRVPNDRFDF
jgi:hypothetical protein